MIKVNVMYPPGDSQHFTLDYYLCPPVLMVARLLETACQGPAVESGT